MTEDSELETIRQRMMNEIAAGRRNEAAMQAPGGVPVTLSDSSFDSFVRDNRIAFVDFWAPWCGPCRMVAPVVEALASELAGKVAFGKLNVDDNPVKSAQFGIMSIPTMMVFRNGKPADMIVGAVPRGEILSRLNRLMAGQ